MSPLIQALKEISYWIENSTSHNAKEIRYGDGGVYCPRPGLSRDMIELYSEEVDLQFSEEVYELYQWHNGTILMGDMANLVYFVPLEKGIEYISKVHFPYLPLFIGDDTFYVVPESKEISPVYHYTGRISTENSWESNGSFISRAQAPSITSLMQAIAECAKTHDGIASSCMEYDTELDYKEQKSHYDLLLSPIYKKYGVVGDSCGLWR
jgi:hypothetical protein